LHPSEKHAKGPLVVPGARNFPVLLSETRQLAKPDSVDGADVRQQKMRLENPVTPSVSGTAC